MQKYAKKNNLDILYEIYCIDVLNLSKDYLENVKWLLKLMEKEFEERHNELLALSNDYLKSTELFTDETAKMYSSNHSPTFSIFLYSEINILAVSKSIFSFTAMRFMSDT